MKNATTLAERKGLESDDIFDIESLYERTIKTRLASSGEKERRQGYFHPSSLGYCSRKNVYEARCEPLFKQATKPRDYEIFQVGHKIHDLVQSIFEDMVDVGSALGLTITVENEKPYDPETDYLYNVFKCGGTTDALVTISDGAATQRAVVEIKSMNSNYFDKLRGPKDDHRIQANLYALRWDAPIIYYWYFNKNTSERRVFKETYDEEWSRKATEKLSMLNDHLERGTLPDREESFYMCPRCDYVKSCNPPVLKKISTKSGTGVKKLGGGTKSTIFKKKAGL